MAKREITTTKAVSPGGSYSQGLVAGNLIFTAGQVGRDPETGEFGRDIDEQTRIALKNVAAVLSEAGAGLDDVVKVTVHLADFGDFDDFDAAYKTFFNKPYPVRTTVGSILDGPLIEIDAIAAKD